MRNVLSATAFILQNSLSKIFLQKAPYDYKFGKAKVTTEQQMRYQTQLPLKPDGTPTAIVEIKPTLTEV